MLRSMTGYGRGEASSRDLTVTVELKSVNNRFRDLNVRCPKEYMALEPRVVTALKGPFARGRIDAYIRRAATGSSNRISSNVELANEYAQVINEIANGMVGRIEREVPLTFIISQPGVLEISENPVNVSMEWDVVEVALESAIHELRAMREAEGESMHRELQQLLLRLLDLVDEVEGVSDGVNERLQKKITKRIQRLLGDQFDGARLAQEAAVLADKADVNEEVARLRSHGTQFQESLSSNEPVGRRLDFLLQEMNREVNTIGSKAAEHPISSRVVDMKTVLERMRELAANVE